MDREHLVAHRGWQRRYPENTLPAIKGALDAGARYIEVDVQLSADGVPVLFHDRTLQPHLSPTRHDRSLQRGTITAIFRLRAARSANNFSAQRFRR